MLLIKHIPLNHYFCTSKLNLPPNNEHIADFTIDAFPWIPQILTVMYRRSLSDKLNHTFYKDLKYKYDVPFLYAVMRCFKICILDVVLGIYRKHDGGIYSGLTGCAGVRKAVETYYDIYKQDKTEIIRELLENSLWNYGYQYVKYSPELSVKEILLTFGRYKEVSQTSHSVSRYWRRIVRACVIRIVKRPYLHPQPVVPDISHLQDTI